MNNGMIAMARAILAGAILAVPQGAIAQNAIARGANAGDADEACARTETANVGIDGVERVVVVAEGGAALFSLYFSKVELSVAGEDRDDVLVVTEDGRSGPGLSGMRPRIAKSGKTLAVTLDFGSFSLVRIGGGLTRVAVSLPSSYRGALDVSLPDGTLGFFDLSLSSLTASINDGKLSAERVNADDIRLNARDAVATLANVDAAKGSIICGLGRVEARELSGSWTIDGSDGSVRLSLARSFGKIEAKTDLGSVTIDVPVGSPFRFEGSSALLKPSADFPLDTSVVKKFPREMKTGMGEVGAGGPLIRVTTAEGRISVTRTER